MDPVKPDYGGAWIGAVVPALLARASSPPPWLPEPAATADGTVLLVLDGLGWSMLETFRGQLPELAGMAGGPITACAPTTTAAGLTSIVTGLTPAEHGMVGYRMRHEGQILNVLRWTVPGGRSGAPDPADVQHQPAFQGAAVPVVTRAEFRDTGFTHAHLRGAQLVGWHTTSSLVEHVRRLVARGRELVYAYYDGIDKIAHAYGLTNGFLEQELRSADRLVGRLLDVLPGSHALLVVADHGQVHVGPGDLVEVDEVAALVQEQSGESRFRYLHARRGAAAELAAGCREQYGDRAWVFTREELLEEGWLGPEPSPEVGQRVGDVILAAQGPIGFLDPSHQQEARLVARHGSLTTDEMLVPLLAARGRAPA